MSNFVQFVHLLRAGVLAMASVVAVWAPSAQAQSPMTTSTPTLPTLQPSSVDASVPATAETQTAVARARAQERTHLQQQRQAIDTALQRAQAACYQRFAAQDCLNSERRRAREATALLAKREAVLNDAERRERAALRLNDIAGRRQAPAEPVILPSARSPEISADVLQQERAFEAQQRAQRLQQKQQRHGAEVTGQIPQRAAAAENARQRLEEKRQAAERRRARALQAQQERAAAGHKPPAALDPLP